MKSPESPADWTPDSPDLTAFALKDGPFEQSVPGWAERRSEAEQAVSRSAPLRAEIGEIRRVADDIETRLAHEAIHRLSADRREAVLAYARNPGRGLPRRSSEVGLRGDGSVWRRFWSTLTRPAMGFSLAAATALSIALALWSPWNSGSGRSRTVAAAPAVSNAPASPAMARSQALTADPVADVSADAVPTAEEATPALARLAQPGPARSPGGLAKTSPVPPREEVQRGETQLQWAPPIEAPPKSPVGRLEASPRVASALKAKALGSAPPIATSIRPRAAMDPAAPAKEADASAPRREARSTREVPFRSVVDAPRSTFPLKPANNSYPQVRQALQEGRLPSPDVVRLEELLNYFSYEQPAPQGSDPLSAQVEVADSPWSPDHRLVKIGLRARSAPATARPAATFVVLVGLRPGSAARLSWVQRSLQSLIEAMDARDFLALLLDGPQGRVILPPTPAAERAALMRGVAALRAEGAPCGLEGLRMAYALAAQRGVPGSVQRVVWILDGEFSAEAGTREALASLIREQTEWGVLLKVLGLGAEQGPSRSADASASSWMPAPAGGAYAAAASQAETVSALRRESLSRPDPTAVADDVQVEVRFNPERVDRWRLIGQETRESSQMPVEAQARSSGRQGARIETGDSVTALYEIVPVRASDPSSPVSRNAAEADASSKGAAGASADLLSLEVSYRSPAQNGLPGKLQVGVPDVSRGADAATADYKFAAAVVGYGLLLRNSPFKGDLTWDKVLELAEEGQGPDREGYRAEFLQLVRKAAALHAAEGRSLPASAADAAPGAESFRPGSSGRP